MRPDSAEIEF